MTRVTGVAGILNLVHFVHHAVCHLVICFVLRLLFIGVADEEALEAAVTLAEQQFGGLDAMVSWGDETAIRRRIQEHWDAGADHVCIQPLHPDGARQIDERILALLAPSAA